MFLAPRIVAFLLTVHLLQPPDSIEPGQAELEAELKDANRRVADDADRLQGWLTSAEGREALTRSWSPFFTEGPGTRTQLEAGAKAFVSILDAHPGARGAPISRVGRPLFPDQPGYSAATSEEAGWILLLGSLYLGIADRTDARSQSRLWEIIAGEDDVNRMLRGAFCGGPFPKPPPLPEPSPFREPLPPRPKLTDFPRDLARRTCVAGIEWALKQLGSAGGTLRATSHAKGIMSLDPSRGCAKDVVTIRGAGFGSSQPQRTEVYFPTRSGGCKQSKVLPNGWTDSAIEVEVPEDVGTGCVGFGVFSGQGGPNTLAEGVDTLLGEVQNCLGPVAAERMRAGLATHIVEALKPPCPPCLPGDVNRFVGGPPVIRYFTGTRHRQAQDMTSTVVDLIPGDMLKLSWRVENADQVQIVPVDLYQQLHELPPVTGPLDPAQGDVRVRWPGPPVSPVAFATFTWMAAYELRASNTCGTIVSTVTVRMHPYPKSTPPTAFYWGAGASGRQVEGNLTADDWEIFTTDPQILLRLDGNKRYDPDNFGSINPQRAGIALNHWSLLEFTNSVERAQALGLNAYRFSIEWSRVEPTSGSYDNAALANYQAMVDAVRARGMEPFVVLNHLSLPAWVSTPPRDNAGWRVCTPLGCLPLGGNDSNPDYRASLRGWERTEDTATVDAYVRYVEKVVSTLRGVRYWITFNEPLGTTIPMGYLAALFPPGFSVDGDKARAAIHNIILAHARAYEAIRRIGPNAQVGITDQWMDCKPDQGQDATNKFVYYHQDFLINALVHGNEDVDIDVDNPKYERVLGIREADWSPHLNFFGLQYYKSVHPEALHPLSILKPSTKFIGGQPKLDLTKVSYAHGLLNDMGWEMYPAGLYNSLMKLTRIAPGLPILVAENGTAEIVDHNRSAYITSHLDQMQHARQDGANVFGYLHWSIADNWEWIDGYRPQARFGLFSVDGLNGTSIALPHRITDGALALAYAINDPPATILGSIERFGRYAWDGSMVEHPSMSPHATFQGTLDGWPVTLLLESPPTLVTPPPVRDTRLTGLLFYADSRRWIRLSEFVWEPATRTLQFAHPYFSALTPERILAATLDGSGNGLSGIASEISGNQVLVRSWQASRAPLAGMWQGRQANGQVLTLSLSCPEGVWQGRVFKAEYLFSHDWVPLKSVNVNATGFSATENGVAVRGVLGPGGDLTAWGVGLQRLPDGLPF